MSYLQNSRTAHSFGGGEADGGGYADGSGYGRGKAEDHDLRVFGERGHGEGRGSGQGAPKGSGAGYGSGIGKTRGGEMTLRSGEGYFGTVGCGAECGKEPALGASYAGIYKVFFP